MWKDITNYVMGGFIMEYVKYHKLVRDRIHEIIEASGNECKTAIFSAEEK